MTKSAHDSDSLKWFDVILFALKWSVPGALFVILYALVLSYF